MTTKTIESNEQLDANELDLLTDLLIAWCRVYDRDPEDLLPKCSVILRRYRNGVIEADQLFHGL